MTPPPARVQGGCYYSPAGSASSQRLCMFAPSASTFTVAAAYYADPAEATVVHYGACRVVGTTSRACRAGV